MTTAILLIVLTAFLSRIAISAIAIRSTRGHTFLLLFTHQPTEGLTPIEHH